MGTNRLTAGCARVMLFIMMGFPLAGCASRPQREIPNVAELLPFLVDGKSLREEIVLKLGEPSAQLESGRILTFRMSLGERGGMAVAPPQGIGGWEKATCSLVVVFDERGILKHHNLVQVR